MVAYLDQGGAGFPSQNEPLRRRKTKNEELDLLFSCAAAWLGIPLSSGPEEQAVFAVKGPMDPCASVIQAGSISNSPMPALVW